MAHSEAQLEATDGSSSDGDNENILSQEALNVLSNPMSVPEEEKPVVLVTGFGTWATYKVNSSWEAVKELERLGVGHNVRLVTMEIPVIYQTVQEEVNKLWDELKPQLVVHVGMTKRKPNEVTLEKQAYNNRYFKPDIKKKCPKGEYAVKGGPDILCSKLDMERVKGEVNASGCIGGVVTSDNPGRFLCGYIYYLSLCRGPERSAFVHVPCLDEPYSAPELALCLREVVKAMMAQLGIGDDIKQLHG